ncbi:unnamed protein product [Thlaspi arvense]|uniref:Uncharacterized protein n=1 Tax=Thlaspi arvense TaxID=13288 RepID=A0AAU9RFN1_THLAR|nr:unnamed protein product [Thlaspi arvense]
MNDFNFGSTIVGRVLHLMMLLMNMHLIMQQTSGESIRWGFGTLVERCLTELRKLGIEQQLWEASRKEIDLPSAAANGNTKPAAESEASS